MKQLKVYLNAFGLSLLILAGFTSCSSIKSVDLSSHDGKYNFQLTADEKSGIKYSVTWSSKPIILESALGFQFADGSSLSSRLVIEHVVRNSVDTEWNPVFGERSSFPDKYNEVVISFSGEGSPIQKFAIRVRAYNEGIVFRYEFDQAMDVEVASELTEFSLEADPNVWVSESSQSPIKKFKLSEVTGACERPLLAELSGSVYVALGEAACVDFAAMRLVKKENSSGTLKVQLETASFKDTYPIHIFGGGYNSPWRFIMAGESPSAILQNNFLILNLNEENEIEDTSWIKPGKAIRETSLSTAGGKACIDFAVKHHLQYIEFDGGWYGDPNDDSSDSRTVSPDPRRSSGPLDLEEVIRYGKEKGIDVIMYVDRRELEKKLDELLPLYQSWGVAGIKFGFVQVGPQEWTRWLHDAIKKAADHGFIVDVHDNYRPTGFSRTYPNLLTVEGIRGDEESPPNSMVINTIYTRMIAGAGDHTNCYFDKRVDENMGSHASQMAKMVCVYSPLQFVFWYDRPENSPVKGEDAGGSNRRIKEIPDLEFYDKVPTVWDDTRIIDGYPGEFAVIARRKDQTWFLGALTGTIEKNLHVKLDFLEPGKDYMATIFSDDASLQTLTHVKISKRKVTRGSVLEHRILEQEGLAVIIEPG